MQSHSLRLQNNLILQLFPTPDSDLTTLVMFLHHHGSWYPGAVTLADGVHGPVHQSPLEVATLPTMPPGLLEPFGFAIPPLGLAPNN